MNAALNGTRRALRLGTGLATCVSCMVFAQTAFGQAVELPNVANANGAMIGTSLTSPTMTVNADGANRVIDWNTFSIGATGVVDFVSRNTMTNVTDTTTPLTVVNRVIGTSNGLGAPRTFTPSLINGKITSTANIAVWLVNPSGITFGASGAFNGGSLVLSTLDFSGLSIGSPSSDNTVDIESRLTNRDVVADPSMVKIDLVGGVGAGSLVSSGGVLLLGEQIDVGKTIRATGQVSIVAASDARITTRAGSPVSYSFVRGTRFNGVNVLGTGVVQGREIVVAASNGRSSIETLLQVQPSGQLIATGANDGIELITAANPLPMETATGASILSRGALRTTGTDATIRVISNGSATLNSVIATGEVFVRTGNANAHTLTVGTMQAGSSLDIRSVGNLTLGTGGNQIISAGDTVTITSGAAINRGGAVGDTLAILSHRVPTFLNGALSVRSMGNMDLGNASLSAGQAGTSSISLSSTAGSIALGSAVANRFSAFAFNNFSATGAITVNTAAVAGTGAALSIAAGNAATDGNITLGSARTTGADQDISIRSSGISGDIQATAITANRNLSLSSTVAADSSLTATTLTAQNGSITALAGSMSLANATAGQSISLRSGGAIAVSGALTSGNTSPLGNVTVSGLPSGAAASFSAGTVNAKTGAVNVQAATQTIGRLVSDLASTLTGTGAITLGSATVGTNLTVTTDGNLTLGTADAQVIGAKGRITLTSKLGAITRGASSDTLTILSNSDNGPTADALTIKARNAVNLGNASLFGGNTITAPVSVQSETANVIMGSGRGTRFTGTAATTFAASGAITANSPTAATGNTIAITGPTGISLTSALTGGTGENIVLNTVSGAVSATSIVAQNNLTIASLANPATSITATTLRAVNGALNAFARTMTLGTARAGTSLGLRGEREVVITGLARAETNVTVSALTAAGLGVFEAPSVTAATGSVDIKANRTDIGAIASGLNTKVEGVTALLGSITAGATALPASQQGNVTVKTSGIATLGKLANQSITAKGAVTIDSATDIRQGATGLLITSNNDGQGAEALTLKAGNAIILTDATLNGGAAKQSVVKLTSGGATTIGKANSAAFTADAVGAFRAVGPIVTTENAAITAGGAVTLNNVTAGGADRDIKITTPGAITAATLKASGDVAVGGGATSLRATLIDATAGSIDIKAGATNVDTALAGTNINVTGTTAVLGAVTAGKSPAVGNLTVKTTGDISLGKLANQRQSATGAITVESTTGSILQGATGLIMTSNSTGTGTAALALKAGSAISLGDATLNGGTAQQSAVALTSGAATTIGKANAAAFTVNSGGAFRANGAILAKENAVITAGGAVNLTNVTVSGATRDLTITTPGAVNAGTLKADRNVTVGGGATSLRAAVVDASNGSIEVKAGATDIGTALSGLNTRVTGTTAILGTVTAGKPGKLGNLTVVTTGNTTLGKLANQKQSATGAIAIESTAGSIRQGATGLVLTSNSNGAGAETLTLKAGSAIVLGDATLNGGTTAERSAIRLTSGTTTGIGSANAAAFTATAGGAFTANGPVVATQNAAIASGSTITLDTVTTTGAGRDIAITTPGAITAGTLKATRNVTVAGGATSFRATAVDAMTGAIDVRAGATDIAMASSGGSTRITGASAVLGTVTAGKTSELGGLTVLTTGNITLGKSANQKQSATAAVLIESTNGSILQGATGLQLTSNSDGRAAEALTLKAKNGIALGDATLGGTTARQSSIALTAGTDLAIGNASGGRVTATAGRSLTANGAITAQSVVSLKSGTDTTIGSASGQTFTAVAGRDFTANRTVSATGNATITATRKITTVGALSAGNAVKLSASDATIGGAVTAKTIDVTNTGSSALVIGGDAETVAGKFTLNRAEAARLRASETLTLGADGSDDVELKQVALSVPKTVQVLANGKRIDVTGRVSFDSNTTLKLGGDVATGARNASIVQVASDSGGRIEGADGRLELGANNIIVGNNALIKTIDDASGINAKIEAASSLNRRAGSVLYNGGETQAVLVRAGSMKINFSGFALFQNTGTSLLGQGVSLGAPGTAGIALDLASPSATPVLAMFGSINGVVNNATALLGNPPLARYSDIALSRLNGCVIGGGNCLSVQNLTPSLTAVDNIRTSIFTVKPDFQVPFDPLVGTNNDALFDDVGSFGLGELPMAPIECSAPGAACSTQKKDGK